MQYTSCNIDSLPQEISHKYMSDFLCLGDIVKFGKVNRLCKQIFDAIPGWLVDVLIVKESHDSSLKDLLSFSGNSLNTVSQFSYRYRFKYDCGSMAKEMMCRLLSLFRNVRSLNLRDCNYGDVLADSMHLEKVTNLNLRNTGLTSHALGGVLQKLKSIEALDLCGLPVQGDALLAIPNKSKVKELHIDSELSGIIQLLMESFTGLEVLEVKFRNVTDYPKLVEMESSIKHFLFPWNASIHNDKLMDLKNQKEIRVDILEDRKQSRRAFLPEMVFLNPNARKRLFSGAEDLSNKRAKIEEEMNLD